MPTYGGRKWAGGEWEGRRDLEKEGGREKVLTKHKLCMLMVMTMNIDKSLRTICYHKSISIKG